MRSIVLAYLLFLSVGLTSAQEFNSRVSSLKEAMDISKANPKKHILVYYKNYRT